MYRNLTALILILFFIAPVSAEITGYWPGPGGNFIGTTDILDITNGPDESVVFATSNGLSIFNKGQWTILHPKAKDRRGYLEGIPLDNYVKCVEYDCNDNLWLGFGEGIQIYDGYTPPVTLKYPQKTLISYSINDLQSLGEQMWVATGDSGVYCYQNGEWRWFQPFSENGLNANRIKEMAVDYSTGTLFLTSEYQGHFILLNDDPINPSFEKIKSPFISDDMKSVRTNYFGGVYFFNQTDIVSYIPKDGSSHILNVEELSDHPIHISDIYSTYDGSILIGTNQGLYVWRDGTVRYYFSGKNIVNNQIKTVFVDTEERWWFANKLIAGYYYQKDFEPAISFEIP